MLTLFLFNDFIYSDDNPYSCEIEIDKSSSFFSEDEVPLRIIKNSEKISRHIFFANGDLYTGPLKDGEKHGNGIYIFANGLKYTGQWKNDKMNGFGSLSFPDGGIYYGQMKNNTITGKGIFKYTDGSIYEGSWKNGKWHGPGKYLLPDGRVLKGIFADNRFIKPHKKEENTENIKKRGYREKQNR